MPHQHFVFVPQLVMGKTPTQLRAYVDGADPVTGQPVMQAVVSALSTPLRAEELAQGKFDRSTERFLAADTAENLRQQFQDNRWTDYLPIVLPTAERVVAMLAGTSHRPDAVVERMRPTGTR